MKKLYTHEIYYSHQEDTLCTWTSDLEVKLIRLKAIIKSSGHKVIQDLRRMMINFILSNPPILKFTQKKKTANWKRFHKEMSIRGYSRIRKNQLAVGDIRSVKDKNLVN